MSSEELQRQAYKAEDEGKDFYVHYHGEFQEVIEYIEIDGVETYNEDYEEEIEDAYWLGDSYRAAEGLWRQ